MRISDWSSDVCSSDLQGSKGMSVPEANIGVTRVQSASSQGGPVVLQVVPSLVTGGVERGTIEIAAAIVADGGTAIVASEGGPMENDLRRAGALDRKSTRLNSSH